MSIDDATPEEWDEVHQKLKNLGNRYGNDVDSPFHYNKGNIECIDAIKRLQLRKSLKDTCVIMC